MIAREAKRAKLVAKLAAKREALKPSSVVFLHLKVMCGKPR